jgi:hypothetical protein
MSDLPQWAREFEIEVRPIKADEITRLTERIAELEAENERLRGFVDDVKSRWPVYYIGGVKQHKNEKEGWMPLSNLKDLLKKHKLDGVSDG